MAKTPQPAPPKEDGAIDEPEKRAFKVVHNVVLVGVTHAPGAEIEISRDEWRALHAYGSVAGEWED